MPRVQRLESDDGAWQARVVRDRSLSGHLTGSSAVGVWPCNNAPLLWGGIGGKMFRAYDKATGDAVGELELPGGTTAAPITYMADGTQYIVVTVGWEDMPSEYVALALR